VLSSHASNESLLILQLFLFEITPISVINKLLYSHDEFHFAQGRLGEIYKFSIKFAFLILI
jgi:hypothetical protein